MLGKVIKHLYDNRGQGNRQDHAGNSGELLADKKSDYDHNRIQSDCFSKHHRNEQMIFQLLGGNIENDYPEAERRVLKEREEYRRDGGQPRTEDGHYFKNTGVKPND